MTELVEEVEVIRWFEGLTPEHQTSFILELKRIWWKQTHED